MRAKRPGANENRGETTQGGERDSGRNDPVPTSTNGCCPGPNLLWLALASFYVRGICLDP